MEACLERHRLSQREAARRLGKPLSFVAELLAIRKLTKDLLAKEGVAQLPKQVLVEIARAHRDEQARLVEKALSGTSLEEIRERRSNRDGRARVVYFHERFLLEGHPPLEVRWMRHPDEVTDHELLEALSAVARAIAERRAREVFEVRTP